VIREGESKLKRCASARLVVRDHACECAIGVVAESLLLAVPGPFIKSIYTNAGVKLDDPRGASASLRSRSRTATALSGPRVIGSSLLLCHSSPRGESIRG